MNSNYCRALSIRTLAAVCLAASFISDSEFHSPKLEEIAGEYCAAFVVDVIKKLK
ncbi:MAG: hypothetical protein AB7U82_14905 [Blastocatellales bacterium]